MSLLNPDIHEQDCLPRVGSVYKIEIEVALNYLIPTIASLDDILRSRISAVVALDNMSEDIRTILWDVINKY